MHRKLFCLLFVFSTSIIASSQTQNPGSTAMHLSAAKKTSTFAGTIWTTEWTSKRWDRDYLVTYQQFPTKQSVAAALFDDTGRMAVGATLWIDGSREIIIEDAASGKDGSLLMTGGAISGEGALANFIARANSEGDVTKILRISPVVPKMMCVTGDKIWVFGRDRSFDASDKAYPMLYEYSLNDGLLFSTLPSNTVDSIMLGKISALTMRCSDSQVALLLEPTKEVVRVDVASRTLTRTKYEGLSETVEVSGIALTDSNELFISVRFRTAVGGRNENGVGLFHFIAPPVGGVGQWSPVTEATGLLKDTSLRFNRLLGNRGNDLVYTTKPRPNEDLAWSTVSVSPVSKSEQPK